MSGRIRPLARFCRPRQRELSLKICIYIYIHTHIYTCIHIYTIYIYIHTHTYIYIYIHTYIHILNNYILSGRTPPLARFYRRRRREWSPRSSPTYCPTASPPTTPEWHAATGRWSRIFSRMDTSRCPGYRYMYMCLAAWTTSNSTGMYRNMPCLKVEI